LFKRSLIQLPMKIRLGALLPGVKQPGSEADHSPPSSAEINTAWSYTFTVPMSS